eukprot:UN04840
MTHQSDYIPGKVEKIEIFT